MSGVCIRARYTLHKVLTLISRGCNLLVTMKYRCGNLFNYVNEPNALLSSMGGANFGIQLLVHVFNTIEPLLLIGDLNQLPPVDNCDPSTWTIPVIV